MNWHESEHLMQCMTEALSLMIDYKLDDWKFKWDKSTSRFGQCRYHKKEIGISKHLAILNSLDKVKDTILHEIAHALCPRHGHNWQWRLKAAEIGCTPERCYGSDVIQAKKFIGTCPNCSRTIKRNRRKFNIACKNCCNGRYNPAYKFIWNES